jgi:hypothetical protein
MALNWKSVSADHVKAALKQVGAAKSGNRTSGLIIFEGERALPAKEVLRVSYQLANRLPADAKLKFSSGDGTLKILQDLGFRTERVEKPKTTS